MERAADKLEHLRAEIKRLQTTVDDINNLRDEYSLKRKPLQAEIEQHIREKVELAGMLAKARDEIERLKDERNFNAERIDELYIENERLRAAIQAYLDYCEPEEQWRGEPTLLRIRRQLRDALGNEQSVEMATSNR